MIVFRFDKTSAAVRKSNTGANLFSWASCQVLRFSYHSLPHSRQSATLRYEF